MKGIKCLRIVVVMAAVSCAPKAFAGAIGDVVTLSDVEDYCCAYPTFAPATIGATSPTFGPWADLSVLSSTPYWTWTANFQGAGDDTLVITAISNIETNAGFEDTLTFSSPGWIINNATLVSSSFTGSSGPPTLIFNSSSVTFDTNNFEDFDSLVTYTAVIQLNTSSIPEPTSLMLMGTGLLGLAGGLRRKFLG